MGSRYPFFPPRLELDPTHVEVIDYAIDGAVGAGQEEVLSPDERSRAEQFHFERDRRRFIQAHAGLRSALAATLRCGAGEVPLRIGLHGKPAVAGAKGRVHFNLSHSGDLAMVALAPAAEVGIDLERVREEVEHLALARRSFTDRERDLVLASGAESRDAFFRCWVMKEAYLKARGEGLASSLTAFEVDPARTTDCLLWSSLGDDRRWRLERIEVDLPYVAALAAERGTWTVRRWSGIEAA